MSTVRIYKVAELLDIPSGDVLALLKKNHGIELKSASSTLEEIVARQFVERQAKERGITLPKGDMFVAVMSKSAWHKVGEQIYVQAIPTQMVVRHFKGEAMEKTLDWAAKELEGFSRN